MNLRWLFSVAHEWQICQMPPQLYLSTGLWGQIIIHLTTAKEVTS